jgi:hypothetical protein
MSDMYPHFRSVADDRAEFQLADLRISPISLPIIATDRNSPVWLWLWLRVDAIYLLDLPLSRLWNHVSTQSVISGHKVLSICFLVPDATTNPGTQ